jgi:adenylate kinase
MDPRREGERVNPVRVVILLGPPGAGKGTQASRLAASLGLPHVATGDLFRENREKGTPLGRRAQEFMDQGKLVPDELVLEMLFDRVSRQDCEGGYLLDGFPRTLPQADALGKRLPKDAILQVISLSVPDAVLVDRITGRRTCRSCKNIHHVKTAPPQVAGRCDRCGGALEQRSDDSEPVLRERLAVYRRQTQPLEDYYGSRGVLAQIDGDRAPEAVFDSFRQAVSEGVRA